MSKHEKVPGMKDTTVKPNREQRRHPEKFEQPESAPLSRDADSQPVDVPEPRASSTGHGKKTADKWNQ